jgi:predicted HTH transcriptional regulator
MQRSRLSDGRVRTLDVEELSRHVALGEGDHLEFKRRVPEAHRIAREVVAFANTNGGRVLLGIDDQGAITGLKDPDEQIFLLGVAIETHTDPVVEFTLRRIAVSRKREVLVVEVSASVRRPHFVVEGEVRTAYVRFGEKSMEASREAVRLMRRSNDESGSRFEFGDKELKLMRYLDTYGRISVDQFARLADIRVRQASQTLVILTRARVLQFHPSETGDYFTAVPTKRAG